MSRKPCAKRGCRDFGIGGYNSCEEHRPIQDCEFLIHYYEQCSFKKDLGFQWCFIHRCYYERCKRACYPNWMYCSKGEIVSYCPLKRVDDILIEYFPKEIAFIITDYVLDI